MNMSTDEHTNGPIGEQENRPTDEYTKNKNRRSTDEQINEQINKQHTNE